MSANYEALFDYLRGLGDPEVRVTFRELDRVVGGLPESARHYAAWWSNTMTGQPHAWAWLTAGRRARVDFKAGAVSFVIGPATTPRVSIKQLPRPLSISDETTERASVSIAFDWHDAGEIKLVDGQLMFPTLPPAPGTCQAF